MVVANLSIGKLARCMPAPTAVQAPVAAQRPDIAGTRENTAAGKHARTTKRCG